jgi:peptide/histidine transporter 3/4
MEGEEVYVDWRGNAVDERRHGGIRATLFLHGKLWQPFLN